MKTEQITLNVQEIEEISTVIDRSLKVTLNIEKERFLDQVAQRFFLKDLFYAGSYSIEEVMEQVEANFGNDEIQSYIAGLGSR